VLARDALRECVQIAVEVAPGSGVSWSRAGASAAPSTAPDACDHVDAHLAVPGELAAGDRHDAARRERDLIAARQLRRRLAASAISGRSPAQALTQSAGRSGSMAK